MMFDRSVQLGALFLGLAVLLGLMVAVFAKGLV